MNKNIHRYSCVAVLLALAASELLWAQGTSAEQGKHLDTVIQGLFSVVCSALAGAFAWKIALRKVEARKYVDETAARNLLYDRTANDNFKIQVLLAIADWANKYPNLFDREAANSAVDREFRVLLPQFVNHIIGPPATIPPGPTAAPREDT